MTKMRLPRHVGFIPDGNRRWAAIQGLPRHRGYEFGIAPGFKLFDHCRELGIAEASIYGFTQDNTRRASVQRESFSKACVEFALGIHRRGAALLVVGDDTSPMFPEELKIFRRRQGDGMKVNFLVNYGWPWDMGGLLKDGRLKSHEVSQLDMIVRWGGGRRLSGFLPAQSVYADLYVVDDYWPNFETGHFHDALTWFAGQDRTLGG